jgi:hypothetical protein
MFKMSASIENGLTCQIIDYNGLTHTTHHTIFNDTSSQSNIETELYGKAFRQRIPRALNNVINCRSAGEKIRDKGIIKNFLDI